MRRLLPIVSALLLLSACAKSTGVAQVELLDRLRNPLFAYTYYQDRTQHMVSMIINQDPALKDPAIRSAIEDAQKRSVEAAREADARRKSALGGNFVRGSDYVVGHVILLDGVVYMGPDLDVPPGVATHVYLSKALDPRDAEFPDPTAVDLGILQSHIGDQAYVAPASEADKPWMTVVLYDAPLKRVVGFAQLQEEQ